MPMFARITPQNIVMDVQEDPDLTTYMKRWGTLPQTLWVGSTYVQLPKTDSNGKPIAHGTSEGATYNAGTVIDIPKLPPPPTIKYYKGTEFLMRFTDVERKDIRAEADPKGDATAQAVYDSWDILSSLANAGMIIANNDASVSACLDVFVSAQLISSKRKVEILG